MMILSTLMIVVSGIFSLLINCSEQPRYPLNKNILGILCSVTAFLTAIGWIVFVAKIGSSGREHLHACFGLAIISTIFSVINACLAFKSSPPKAAPPCVAVVQGQTVGGYPTNGGPVIIQTSSQIHTQAPPQYPSQPPYGQNPLVHPPPYQPPMQNQQPVYNQPPYQPYTKGSNHEIPPYPVNQFP
ncbi:unnamed protein product [Dimorphilus gyrociliatus]|uniref:Uncharacterized protein n=1 Tax=Dimorphilus gyrociliatus TaxID=2664684 RepID=A0A7I8W969_9ANNE|nr:unnamed protein product [Dimorphilus gyrociliatus]